MKTALIATGGTVAWDDENGRTLTGADLAARAQVSFDEVIDLEAKPSWDLSLTDLEAIARRACSAIDEGADGVVVLHGTDTLEESAWLTELILGAERRDAAAVLFTGAMRFAGHPGADGPGNLAQAVDACRKSVGRGLGVQIAFAGRLHAARWAVKTDAGALDAFDSNGRPPTASPPPPSTGVLDSAVALLKVGSVYAPPIPEGVHGLVLEGTGASHVPSSYHAALNELLSSGVPVALASRARDVDRASDTHDPFLRAGDLTAEKAALALMVALGEEQDLPAVREWWRRLHASR
ncbi:MAG: asparaginase [Actinomycetota bacterium]